MYLVFWVQAKCAFIVTDAKPLDLHNACAENAQTRKTQEIQKKHMKNLTLDDFTLFVEVAAAQSLSKVARARDVAASHVSRHFARIETECHLRLAHRTTHSLSLTDDGEVFLEIAQRIVSEHAQLRGSLTTRAQAVSGTVRISISQLFAQYVVIPHLAELRARHPNLQVDLHIDDRLVNMAYEGIDIAVRAGVPPADTVIARGLGGHGRALYASPAYLKKHGAPRSPEDLKAHSLITNSAVAAHNRWQFVLKGQAIEELVKGHVRVNSSAAVVSLTTAGAGIGRINDVVGNRLVLQGQLKPVLGRYSAPQQYPVYAAILAERHRAPKIRATMDFLELCFAAFKTAKTV
jgi:DNA-binding transcriptional LysR family regulator